MRAALYTRVSTEEQAESGFSLEAQKRRLIEYCNQKNYEIYSLYSDEGISGTSIEKRDALIKLIKDAEQKKFDVVVVYKTDRLGRSTVDLLTIQKKLFTCGVNLEMSDESFDIKDDAGMAMFSITAVFAEYEHKKISGRTMTGKRQARITNALKPKGNGIVAYGYLYDEIQKRYIADSTKVDIINSIYDYYIDGKSLGEIARIMISKGISFRDRTDGVWNVEMVSRIIRNPLYKGYAGISYYSTIKRGVRLKNDPILVKAANVEPIVSEDKWEKANMVTSVRSFNARKFSKSLFVFGDVAYCSVCGYKLTFTQSTVKNKAGEPKTYRYYNCCGIAHHFEPDFICKGWRRDVKKVNDMFIQFIKGIKVNAKLNNSVGINDEKSFKQRIDSTEQAIKRKTKQREVLLEKLSTGIISDDDYKMMSNKIVQEINQAQTDLATMYSELSKMNDSINYKKNIQEKVSELKHLVAAWDLISDEKKRFIVSSCIKKIYLDKDKINKIEFK